MILLTAIRYQSHVPVVPLTTIKSSGDGTTESRRAKRYAVALFAGEEWSSGEVYLLKLPPEPLA